MKKNKILEFGILTIFLLLVVIVYASPPSLITSITPANQSEQSLLYTNLTCDFSDPEGDPINVTFNKLNVKNINPKIRIGGTWNSSWYLATLSPDFDGDNYMMIDKSAGDEGKWGDAAGNARGLCEKGNGDISESGEYYLNTTSQGWTNHRIACENLNGTNPEGWHLAVPESSAENTYLTNLCNDANYCYIAGYESIPLTDIEWRYNQTTNITLQNNSKTYIQVSPTSGLYNWSCQACDNNGECSPLYQQWFNNSFLGLNFNFLDEFGNYLWAGLNISVELIPNNPDLEGKHGNATMGNISFDDVIGGQYYTVLYSSNQSVTRGFFTQGSTSNITLYMLNNTQDYNEITINVISNINEPLENALVKTYKFSDDIDDYKLVESTLTNFEGKAKQSLILNKYYRILIEYPVGTTVFISDPNLLFSDNLNLVVDTAEDGAANFFEFANVSYVLNFSNSTKTFYYSYVGSSDVTQGCLRLYEWENNEEKLRNVSCSSNNLGIITLSIDPINGSTWVGKAFVTIDSEEYIIDSISKIFGVANVGGSTGIFIILILTVALCSLFFFSPTIALIIAPLPLLIASLIKFIPIPAPIALSVYVVFIILALIVGRRG